MFANANNNGEANANGASNSDANGGVRPLLISLEKATCREGKAGNEAVSVPEKENKSPRRVRPRPLTIQARD